MKTNKNDLEFGLKFEIPDDAPAGWGARAIADKDGSNERMGFLSDRQDMFAITEGHNKALITMLNDAKFLSICQDEYGKARRNGQLIGSEEDVVVLYENQVLCVKADTRASYGYVYVCAYLKPSCDISKAVTMSDDGYDVEDDVLKWSSNESIPNVGDIIDTKGLGDAIVIRHINTHGYLLTYAWPKNPPDWYKKQVQEAELIRHKAWNICGFYGAAL